MRNSHKLENQQGAVSFDLFNYEIRDSGNEDCLCRPYVKTCYISFNIFPNYQSKKGGD